MKRQTRINPTNPLEKLLCDALNWRYDQQESVPCGTNLSGTDYEAYKQFAIVLGNDGHFTLAPVNGGGGGTTWGQITGDLKNQKDLGTELSNLDKKYETIALVLTNFQTDQKTFNKLVEQNISDLKNNKQDKIDFTPQMIDISIGNLPRSIEYKNARCIYSQITQIGIVRAIINVGADFLCPMGTPIFSGLPKLDGAEENVAYGKITDSNGVVQFGLGFNSSYGKSVLVNLTDYKFAKGTTLYLDGVGIGPPYKK